MNQNCVCKSSTSSRWTKKIFIQISSSRKSFQTWTTEKQCQHSQTTFFSCPESFSGREKKSLLLIFVSPELEIFSEGNLDKLLVLSIYTMSSFYIREEGTFFLRFCLKVTHLREFVTKTGLFSSFLCKD